MLNLCMVGTGGIAAEHMKALRALKGVDPCWVVSRTPQKAKEFAAQWGFEHSGVSLEEALADRRVQLVVIASPSEQHSSQALLAMQAGKNVIVEIPVGLSFAEAQRVANVSS